MRLASWTVLLGLLLSALAILPAQQQLAERLTTRRAATAPASVEWFVRSLELADAQSQFDLGIAVATATDAFEAAGNGPPGARAAAAAQLGRLVTRRDGFQAAEAWWERAGTVPGDAAPALRFRYLAEHAMASCLAGDHARELQFSVPAQAIADSSLDEPTRLRAAMITLHASPGRGLAELRRRFRDALQGPAAEEVEFLVPWLLLEDARAAAETRRLPEFELALAAAEVKAEVQGNLRVLAVAANFRGNGKAMARDAEGAALHYAAACEQFTRLGDRLETALAIDMRAFVEVKRERLDAAETFLRESEALCADRGMNAVEEALLQTRFQLAVARSDGPAAAAIAAEIQRRKEASIELDTRLVAAREELRKAEEERAAAEERLRAENYEAALRARGRTEQLVTALVVTLGLLVAISWWSRRRLLRGHQELTAQFERAEAAQQSRDVLEQRMRQMQQAESLGTLAAGVAHDFNNLLTSVLGSTELVRMRTGDPETRSLLDTIETAGRQAARLCKQLQTYGGDEPLDAVPVDLAHVVQRILPVLASSTRGRIELRFVPPAETVGAFADATQLDQLLLNLVVNAADARAHAVTVTLARRERAHGFDGPAAVLTVEDDGDGMTQEVAQRIFDPFFTTRFPGRGLGLAVVHGVVRRHGGSIHVDSAPGLGAKFVIELPLAIVAPGGNNEPIVVLPQQSARAAVATKVLVVDDEPEVGRVLVRMLGMLGHPAEYVGSGAEALRRAEAHPRDAALTVFVDLTMPEMDGDELIQRLRQVRADARVVLMSGHTQDIVERAAAAHAPDAVLGKPFQLAAVRAAVGGGATIPATAVANE